MVKFINDFIGSSVILFQEKVRVGMVSDVIIESKDGSFLGFFVSLSLKGDKKVVSIRDMKGFGNGVVMINDFESLSDPGDIVKIQNALKNQPQIIKSRVETESGQKLGKVTDATINFDYFSLEKIYVEPSISIKFLSSQLIISKEKIVKIEKKKIVVSDEYVTAKDKKLAVVAAPAID